MTGKAPPNLVNIMGKLDSFIAGLGDRSINLWQGPLNFQDGAPFLKEGETATDQQIWYMPQLLEGIEGASSYGQVRWKDAQHGDTETRRKRGVGSRQSAAAPKGHPLLPSG